MSESDLRQAGLVRYKAVSQVVREIFQRHTEMVEPLSLDEAYLDVTEKKTGLPTATRVAKVIRKRAESHGFGWSCTKQVPRKDCVRLEEAQWPDME